MKIVNDFDLKRQAEELGVSVWKTPSFLLIMMGVVTSVAMAAVYLISRKYDNPEILILTETTVVSAILIFGNSIITQIEVIAKLNRQKTEFVSIASHQLRTPLGAIRWETELLLSKMKCGMDDRQCKGIESINILAARMARLVSDLLDVTRIDQGRMALRKENVSLEETISEVMEDSALLAKTKNLHVTINKKCDTKVIADKQRIKLVVENLVNNAIKYTKNNGKIEMRLFKKDKKVIFEIKDSGVGIPREQQFRVFDKFFRSSNVLKYQTEGTGLGLYIAKSIVEQSGGEIWFRSEENIGSIFSFSLPVA